MVLFVLFVLGIVGVVSAVQFHLNDQQNVQSFVYRGKNLSTYISALLLVVFVQVRVIAAHFLHILTSLFHERFCRLCFPARPSI